MSAHPGFLTEIDFELPRGYVDDGGMLHRKGVMRLATAADEILPMRDPRVQENEAYLPVIILARVITCLGSLKDIHPGVIEGLYASDLGFLEELYAEFNARGESGDAPGKPAGTNGHSLHRINALGEA
ncbi:hypothetical protein [Rhizobium sp. WYJ-E13]|uniref:hypothetical protein n=1 Tax=Rhizobium sp. WYJ-E13 TaxID=2849093 RepID=UPI001C1EEACA|nr:hypothetical protein [Rhizobium sp. WYJ-E13]QWW71217.1 hypothetical protein KQ933_31180 [Rhizobium sp. WYJ-E13]